MLHEVCFIVYVFVSLPNKLRRVIHVIILMFTELFAYDPNGMTVTLIRFNIIFLYVNTFWFWIYWVFICKYSVFHCLIVFSFVNNDGNFIWNKFVWQSFSFVLNRPNTYYNYNNLKTSECKSSYKKSRFVN